MQSTPVSLRATLAAAIASVALGLTSVTGAAEQGVAAESLEQRVRSLEDRAAITQLIVSDYADAIDRTDTQALAALFTVDGEFASRWTDLASMPEKLREVFAAAGQGRSTTPLQPQIAFLGRETIASYMALVFTATPSVTTEGSLLLARFRSPPRPGAAPPPPPPPNPNLAAFVSMRHVVTNPLIRLDGDRATATSYWTEIGVGRDGKHSVVGGGYYSDVLARVQGAWRFRQRIIHNYDIAPAAPPGPAP